MPARDAPSRRPHGRRPLSEVHTAGRSPLFRTTRSFRRSLRRQGGRWPVIVIALILAAAGFGCALVRGSPPDPARALQVENVGPGPRPAVPRSRAFSREPSPQTPPGACGEEPATQRIAPRPSSSRPRGRLSVPRFLRKRDRERSRPRRGRPERCGIRLRRVHRSNGAELLHTGGSPTLTGDRGRLPQRDTIELLSASIASTGSASSSISGRIPSMTGCTCGTDA